MVCFSLVSPIQVYRRAATPPITPATAPMAMTAELPVASGAPAVEMEFEAAADEAAVTMEPMALLALPAAPEAEGAGPEVTGPPLPRRPLAEAMESSWL